MKTPTLLDKAKTVKPRSQSRIKINSEVIELALAWAQDEITLTQVGSVLKGSRITGSTYVTLATALRQAIREGILKCH